MGLMIPCQQVKAQADCNTAAGVLALMSAKVVVGTPQSPADLPPLVNSLLFKANSEVFRVTQNETSNTSCLPKITFILYTSTSSTALSGLPALATANASFTPSSSIKTSTMTSTRTGNTIAIQGSRVRADYPKPTKGLHQVFYRIAKRIRNCSTCSGQDPFVWSSVYSFIVPAAPAPPPPPPVVKAPDLIPQPTSASNRNRSLFKPIGASYGAGSESFLKIPDEFCLNTVTQGTFVKKYPCGSDSCLEYQQSFALTPVIYAAKNSGDSVSGSFSVSLFRKDQTLSSSSSLTAVSTNTVNSLGINVESTIFSFNPNKTVTVFAFPTDNPGSCFVRCDPNTAGCTPPYQELEYKVKVDGGNSASTGTVSEKSETNNEGNPMK